VVVASYSEGARERLQGLMEDEGLADARPIRDWTDVPDGKGGVFLAVWGLEHGFEGPIGKTGGLTVISEQDVLGDRLIRAPRKKRRAENFLTEAQSLSPGDLVVHVDHGVGRYMGLEVVTALGAAHECLLLEYAGSDRLYLPVENIELLTRFGHEEGLLDRLGGGAWQAKKARLKERIREIAERLIRVAAERLLRSAPIMEPPDGMWDAFSARFPYEETDDQLKAISDVLEDLQAGIPMDRLICGDVGFGKTEVAMRAAFVAAMSGAQVAVIAPTTLLARQHYKSFADRFRGFPVNIRPLSRFVSPKDADRTREGLADGTVDIVVGTHALLAKGIRFRNLGLLVIDEEQHFGVSHKERLKAASNRRPRPDADRHADPPHAATISHRCPGSVIIGTPPVDRLAIRTYVSEFDAITIREALLREHYRGGQSFFVVPRIADLPEMEQFLRDQVPGSHRRHRARPDGGGRARRPDERLLRRQVRRAPGHDHRGIGPRHPHRQHDGHPPRRHVRPGAALPDPGAGGPFQDPRLRVPHDETAREADACRGEAAACAGLARQPWAQASRWRARTSTSAARATSWARSSRVMCARWATNSTSRCWRRRSRSSRRANSTGSSTRTPSGRRRSTSACRC
jgi:transcription-repair coupling factor (superfamily II helicase)